MKESSINEPKLCECGCGNETKIARRTYTSYGIKKGQKLRFIQGHNIQCGKKSLRWNGGMETIKYQCDVCKNEFRKIVNNQRFCSKECAISDLKRYGKERRTRERELVPFVEKTCYCGRVFKTKNPKKVMCREPKCLLHYQNTHMQSRYAKDPQKRKKYVYEKKEELLIERESEVQIVNAICPGCGEIHEYKFFPAWIGRGIPRMNCPRYPYCIPYELREIPAFNGDHGMQPITLQID